ncbi:hypothetical protein F4825DRAFT_350867 [Nemania diffusa]|nr:hypothetical protein F4825DRAFT_350867 [Nemania diffusa]
MATNPTADVVMGDSNPAPAPQVTEVYDKMRGFLKGTHWSKPYYSALVHNNPQLPYHLLEHVNCTYLSTPGRAPTLLALKQHAQSLAVLISLLAPAQFGGTLEPPNEGKTNGSAPFAAEQAFDWLNDLQSKYNTDDGAHKKPLNALANLVKSNSDTEGPKWHCPLDTTGIEFPENHPFQQYRPYESHMTLLMHANEILERLDHEYSAMGGILGLIPLDNDNVEEQRALKQAKTTLVGQWILYTQHLVVRMHELEIAYGNSLDLLANEAIVPMQHISIHGPDGRSGREIVFPQDRWILANAGEDVFTFIHQILDRAEAHQDAQDDVFSEQNVLGDAAFSSNRDAKYRGIVKVDLNTRFYRLRNSGHGPLFVLPAFGDRPNTQHTRDIENRPTVVTIPQPDTKEIVSSWESKHKDIDVKLLKLTVDKSNLEAKVSQLDASVAMRDREIDRLNNIQKQYDGQISEGDRDLTKQIVHLQENVRYVQKLVREGDEREKALKQDIENFKKANLGTQNDPNPVGPLVEQINAQQSQMRKLQKEIQERENKMEELQRDNDTLRILNSSPYGNTSSRNSGQVAQLQAELAGAQQERQMLQKEIHSLRQSKVVKGKILNFPEGFTLDYGSTFEDTNLGITACNTVFYKALLAAEKEKNDNQQKLDGQSMNTHTIQAELDQSKAENEQLRKENQELRSQGSRGSSGKIINLPWGLQHTSTFRDDNQGLIVLTTQWYDHLVDVEKSSNSYTSQIASLEQKVKDLKTPVDVNLSGIFDSAQEQLGQVNVFKDTQRNIAVLTLSYLEELQNSEQTKNANQQSLNEYQRNVQTLQQQLKESKAQVEKGLREQNNIASELPDLQNQLDIVQRELDQSQQSRQQLQGQINLLTANTSASDLKSQALELQKQVDHATRKRQKKESELAELETRHTKLRLNETNLRTEVASLRKQLSDAKRAAPKSAAPAPLPTVAPKLTETDSQVLRELRGELKLYKGELETVQNLWNDLQTQHVILQRQLEKAQRQCDEEKAQLQLQVTERDQSIGVLQMKVASDPNKLQPAIIELEAQRDAARKHRDELQQRVNELQQQLR